jgi:hypothetical protein
MALDATPGGENANSYVTVSEADSYFRDRLHSASWDALDYTSKSSALITSTSMLDWYMEWEGSRATAAQSLDWPRIGTTGEDETVIPSDIIPKEVKTATFELALSIAESDRTEDWNMQGLSKMKVGDLEMVSSYSQSDNPKPSTIPEKIYNILKNLIIAKGPNTVQTVRLSRA